MIGIIIGVIVFIFCGPVITANTDLPNALGNGGTVLYLIVVFILSMLFGVKINDSIENMKNMNKEKPNTSNKKEIKTMNREQNNPIGESYAGLRSDQKKSIINMLSVIMFTNGAEAIGDNEMKFMNTYIDSLQVSLKVCQNYHSGNDKIINDLVSISSGQKEFLVISVMEMISSDGKPSEEKIKVMVWFFQHLGVEEDEMAAIFDKAKLLMNKFL